MDKSKFKKKIEKFIFEKLKLKNKRYLQLKKNTNLFEQGIDSMDFFSLIFDLESNYDIKVNQKMYSKLNTINKIVIYILDLAILTKCK
jgi:acyl carrier protein